MLDKSPESPKKSSSLTKKSDKDSTSDFSLDYLILIKKYIYFCVFPKVAKELLGKFKDLSFYQGKQIKLFRDHDKKNLHS